MKWFLIKILFVFVSLSAQEDLDRLDVAWESYKLEFEKTYETPEEEATRKANFIESLNLVTEHNKLYENGGTSYTMTIPEDADLSNKEMVQIKTGITTLEENSTIDTIKLPLSDSSSNLPKSFDWRKQGKVTPVKKQGTCSSNWAFCALSVIESQLIIEGWSINNIALSVQQMLDCFKGSLAGCNGGGPMSLVRQLKDGKYGIAGDNSYPYEAVTKNCRRNLREENFYIAEHDLYSNNNPDETKMQKTMIAKGPMIMGVAVSENLIHYDSGVFDVDPICTPTYASNHVVTLVGYGETANGVKYWIAKNSWGTEWGENGYIRILRGTNFCKIGNYYGIVYVKPFKKGPKV